MKSEKKPTKVQSQKDFFSSKINRIDKPLAKLSKRKVEETEMSRFGVKHKRLQQKSLKPRNHQGSF